MEIFRAKRDEEFGDLINFVGSQYSARMTRYGSASELYIIMKTTTAGTAGNTRAG